MRGSEKFEKIVNAYIEGREEDVESAEAAFTEGMAEDVESAEAAFTASIRELNVEELRKFRVDHVSTMESGEARIEMGRLITRELAIRKNSRLQQLTEQLEFKMPPPPLVPPPPPPPPPPLTEKMQMEIVMAAKKKELQNEDADRLEAAMRAAYQGAPTTQLPAAAAGTPPENTVGGAAEAPAVAAGNGFLSDIVRKHEDSSADKALSVARAAAPPAPAPSIPAWNQAVENARTAAAAKAPPPPPPPPPRPSGENVLAEAPRSAPPPPPPPPPPPGGKSLDEFQQRLKREAVEAAAAEKARIRAEELVEYRNRNKPPRPAAAAAGIDQLFEALEIGDTGKGR
jgi:hypothetical protein